MSIASRLVISLFAVFYSFVIADQVYAYLDPGSGSMMLQLLFGGIAGLVMILKLYWKSFTSLFRRKGTKNEAAPGQEPDS